MYMVCQKVNQKLESKEFTDEDEARSNLSDRYQNYMTFETHSIPFLFRQDGDKWEEM